MRRTVRAVQRAFTLIEMMIVVALVGIIALLAAPSFNEMIGMQRLRGINEQIVTDVQFVRGEAMSRNQFMGFVVRSVAAEAVSCYTAFSSAIDPLRATALVVSDCNCANGVGSACANNQRELRTVHVPRGFSIDLRFPPDQGPVMFFSPINGGMIIGQPNTAAFSDLEFCIEVRRSPRGRLRTTVGASGRSSQCSPDGSVPGVATCPPYDATLRNCQAAS